MGNEIRTGQLIAPFGPGSIYTDKRGVSSIICGLDYWYCKPSQDGQPEKIDFVEIHEPRLSELLGVPRFVQPPEYVTDKDRPNSFLKVPILRFPTWYVNQYDGSLRKLNWVTQNTKNLPQGNWKPVRFISVCSAGHIGEFPWQQWIGCHCENAHQLTLHDSGGAGLDSIRVHCRMCGKKGSLQGAMTMQREGDSISESGLKKKEISCHGERPWLGDAGPNKCHETLVAALLNQSNVYSSRTTASIFIPSMPVDPKLQELLMLFGLMDGNTLNSVKLIFRVDKNLGIVQLKNHPQSEIGQFSDQEILDAYEAFLDPEKTATSDSEEPPTFPESDFVSYRRAEYNVLRNEADDPKVSELRVLPTDVPESLKNWISRINLVEKLRETRVFYGFDRLQRAIEPLNGMPDSAINQLFRTPPEPEQQWLPAVKNYGEGVYIELNEEKILDWLEKRQVWLQARYDESLVQRMASEYLLMPPLDGRDWKWAARYQLVHTLAHVLINQLVFASGYASASLKERLYVSPDSQVPMAGLLIYTAAGDSEGSLGGLVRQGHPELFEPMLLSSLKRASWCSADPVCSENLGGTGTRLVNKAACHACVLLPETACETINNGLDRAAVVGTPENREEGFFSELLNDMVNY